MRKPFLAMTLSLTLCATWIAAHTGVSNPAVLKRMESMKQQQDATKVLGQMAKGETPFDPKQANLAVAKIAKHAGETIALFRAQENDPKSEALPSIWENFADFELRAEALETLTRELAGTLETRQDLNAGLARLGAACKSCHQEYRK
ncbi:c-type cytochrome [Thalassococcus lentus]|uniref:Cytochrome c n=1 Tax=Thalassococcus lentus TaxID=1210524 RepID=A0ABT4XWB6_9RHOB|nr:cytochrome c [Thalassococcus lentus]MDA7426140.1 cytochrome c [Thalassococcus lentus]